MRVTKLVGEEVARDVTNDCAKFSSSLLGDDQLLIADCIMFALEFAIHSLWCKNTVRRNVQLK